jgi:hypothetical protein
MTLGARTVTLVRLSTLLGTPRSLHLHTRVALHSCTEQTSPSIAAMTSGSIGIFSININRVGEHLEKRTNGLTVVHIFYVVNSASFL